MVVEVKRTEQDTMQITSDGKLLIITDDNELLDFMWDYMGYVAQNDYYSGKIAIVNVRADFWEKHNATV